MRLLKSFIILNVVLMLTAISYADDSVNTRGLMPVPEHIIWTNSAAVRLDQGIEVTYSGHQDPRIHRAIERLLSRLHQYTGIPMDRWATEKTTPAKLVIHCKGPGQEVQGVEEIEAYELNVVPISITLNAQTVVGILRGLTTVEQLVEMDQHGFVIPAVEIKDQPRFPWRGILIDVCRHWQPKEVILRNIDGLAAVKMNVIHLHLSEDQGFRVESKRFPKLHELGADGKYFTQDDIREIIAYARDRGIRVVPEFDMPAHATSWFVGYPEFASAPGPYEIERKWGVFDPCFDPTREEVYQFLDEFIGEMAKLFPDQYFHIGGDEVTNKHWEENESIQSFMKEHNLTDYRHLQAHFSTRVAKIVASHGKTMAGWDEILHPDIPKGSLVQSWRGHNSLVEAARNDLQTILSHGFYLDHIKPASYHYNNEPLPLGVNIEGEDRTRVLGGEACMWAEYVSPETIDSRIWPRAGAVAERLWSPRDTNNVTDMYRRLSLLSDQLDRIGLLHEANRRRMLKRLTAGGSTESLEVLADVVHEVQMYGRQKKKYTSATPLNRLTDAVRPESKTARDFEQVVDHMLTSGELENQRDVLALWSYLQMWKGNHARLLPIIQASPLLHEIEPVSRNLARAAEIGLEAIKHWQEGTTANAEWVAEQKLFLEQAAQPTAELELAVIPAVTKLVDAAALETVNIASEK